MADAEEVGGPAPKKRRLGQKQRLALLDEANADALAAKQHSALATFLLEQWAWGHISAQLVQQMASKAIEDMQQDVPGQLQRLGKLGGGYSNKMSADMMASNKSSLCKPFLLHLPYKKKKAPLQKMLLPHELFASIYEKYPDTFQNVLVGPPESLATFWSTNISHPAMQGHPCLGDMSKKVPLAMHGDGVPITGLGKIWSKTAWVYSWCSLLSDAATKDKQFLIGMVWDTLQGPNTMEKFHTVIAWSFKYLQLGIWPLEDHEGKPHLLMHIRNLFFLLQGTTFIIIMPLYSNTSPGIVLAPWATKKKANHLLEAGQAYYSLSRETWITTAMFSNCPDGRIRKGAASIARQTQKVLMDGKIFHKVHHGYQRLGTQKTGGFTPTGQDASFLRIFQVPLHYFAVWILCTINTWDAINIALEASCYCSANSIFFFFFTR